MKFVNTAQGTPTRRPTGSIEWSVKKMGRMEFIPDVINLIFLTTSSNPAKAVNWMKLGQMEQVSIESLFSIFKKKNIARKFRN